MQLLANGVAYREDPYIDMKYQIDAFNMCFAEGLFRKIRRERVNLRAISWAFVNIFTAKLQYTDTVDAFFSCYDYPKLQHYIINSHPYVMDSIYVYQVQNWLKHFSREQILFIKGEDILSPFPLLSFFIFKSLLYIVCLCFHDMKQICSTMRSERWRRWQSSWAFVNSTGVPLWRQYTTEDPLCILYFICFHFLLLIPPCPIVIWLLQISIHAYWSERPPYWFLSEFY